MTAGGALSLRWVRLYGTSSTGRNAKRSSLPQNNRLFSFSLYSLTSLSFWILHQVLWVRWGGGGGPSLHCISIPKLLAKLMTPHTYTRLHILLPGLFRDTVRYDNMCKIGLQGRTLRSLTWFCKPRFDWWTWFSTRCSQILTICKIMGLTPVVRGTSGQVQLCRSK